MTTLYCTALAPAPLMRVPAILVGLWPGWARLRGHLVSMVFAACLATLPAAMILHAEEAPQSWLPSVLALPDDMEVLSDRAVGSSLRMFSLSTKQDPDALLKEWEEALDQAGYFIDKAQDDAMDRVIEFSGQGINNAKIAVSPVDTEERKTINFDATLQ